MGKSGFNSKNATKTEVSVYKDAIEMVEKSYEIYSEVNDKEGMQLVADTMANINIRATMLTDPDETKQITKYDYNTGARMPYEVIEIWNETEVKLEITRDGKDLEKIKKTKYEVVPMDKKEGDATAVEDAEAKEAIAG